MNKWDKRFLNKWDKRFLELAKHVASWSKDPSTKVGAVIVDKSHRVISVGFNGFPRGIEDSEEFLNNKEEKYKRILHAEQNALIFAHSKELKEATLFVYPLPPCNRCALDIIQYGISRVVSYEIDDSSKWKDSIELTKQLFKEAGVELELYKEHDE